MQKTKIFTATKIYAFLHTSLLAKIRENICQNRIFAVSFVGHVGGATRFPNPGSTSVSSSRVASGDTRIACTVPKIRFMCSQK